jgi:hypothetical protein
VNPYCQELHNQISVKARQQYKIPSTKKEEEEAFTPEMLATRNPKE